MGSVYNSIKRGFNSLVDDPGKITRNIKSQTKRAMDIGSDTLKAAPTGYNAAKGRLHTMEDATDALRKYRKGK